MNYRLRPEHSVVLMSRRRNAPYVDRVEEGGAVIVYEGHDIRRSRGGPDPKTADQELRHPGGSPTQNGRFFEAAKSGQEVVRVYEKLLAGVWVYNGAFLLTAAWGEVSSDRRVFKFRLELTEESETSLPLQQKEPSRVIPSPVKRRVWERDGGKCVLCGESDELHFDHDVPFSRGGASNVDNVRLLCARHNLSKGAKIE
ncbi:MAG: HNH endonuclease [Dehalococcoidia bacterium]|nr:HNH endonuclease [Dehalococcoidia bacterium]